jgi:hypothetical protein
MRWSLVVLLWLASAMVLTQAHAQENWFQADFRGEHKRVSDACKGGFKAAPACAIELFTDHPLHIAAGSLPAQNGFGLGLAFSQARNTTNWRVSWDADAVGSTNGSWRAGGYMKFVHTPNEPAHVIKVNIPSPTQPGEPVAPKPAVKKKNIDLTHTYTVFNLYAQTISLNKLNYFGEGNESALSGASVFGMTQTVVGASVIKPVNEWEATKKLNLSLNGEVNGRFVDIRGESGQSVPSIETLYTNATAPGLTSQPAFVQLGQGIRIKPVIADHLELNYSGTLQEFVAPSSSQNSFERWTVDLNHTLNLYGNSESPLPTISANDKGPDSCAYFDDPCPQVSHTRNLNGSIGARLLLSESINSATSTVPFYFQPTLGGSDINGALALGSYQDYRFRAPNLLLVQENFEHSIWGPFGVKVEADQGRVALTRSDIGFDHLRHSYAAGFTLRAGGFPMVSMMFAWGGAEGHHNLFNMNPSLLGGSARPLLD